MAEEQLKPTMEDGTLADRIGRIERLETELMGKTAGSMKLGDAISHSDMFVMGALKRTLAQSKGFRDLIATNNFPCAAAILRMQIDTAMRVNALLLVEEREAFCRSVLFDGKRFDTLKDSAGEKLKDRYLRKKLAEKYPWVSQVYEQASDFVHLSGRHFYSAVSSTDDNTQTAYLVISGADPPRSDGAYFEIVDTFFEVSRVIALMLCGYFSARASSFGNQTTVRPESG